MIQNMESRKPMVHDLPVAAGRVGPRPKSPNSLLLVIRCCPCWSKKRAVNSFREPFRAILSWINLTLSPTATKIPNNLEHKSESQLAMGFELHWDVTYKLERQRTGCCLSPFRTIPCGRMYWFQVLLLWACALGDISRFSPRIDQIFPWESQSIFWCSRWRIFGISFYLTAFSFLTLNKFT